MTAHRQQNGIIGENGTEIQVEIGTSRALNEVGENLGIALDFPQSVQ